LVGLNSCAGARRDGLEISRPRRFRRLQDIGGWRAPFLFIRRLSCGYVLEALRPQPADLESIPSDLVRVSNFRTGSGLAVAALRSEQRSGSSTWLAL